MTVALEVKIYHLAIKVIVKGNLKEEFFLAIILASQSPRRKELLARLVADFKVEPADIDETVKKTDLPEEYVIHMAKEKAKVIAAKHPNDLVIASDTIVVNHGKILGKPESRAEAFTMLKDMSGGMHHVYTAVVMRKGHQVLQELVPAKVLFFELSDEEINRYLDTGEYADKAGAYGIQDQASLFVKKVDGDYYSIVGFPVGVVNQMLKKIN